MSTADPISLAQAKRLAANADTILLRATRPADLETPIGAFLRLDDGGPAYLLESVEGGERLGRYSFLGVGPRRLLEVRDGLARIQTRPVTVPTYAPDLPVETVDGRRSAGRDPRLRAAPPRPADRGHAALHRRRGRAPSPTTRSPASSRPSRCPERDPVGVPTGRLHRDRPRARLRPPDPHAVGDRLAAHRDAPTSRAATGSPRRPSSRRSSGPSRPSAAELARPAAVAARRPAAAARRARSRPASAATSTSTPSRSPRTRSPSGEAIQVVLARRQSFDLPLDPATGADPRRDRPLPRAPPRQPEPVPVLRPHARLRGRRRLARSSSSRSRATSSRPIPIAGTRPRGADAREDALLAEQLQRDPKERAEHVMLVDLGRNDLGRVSRPGTVTVSKYMEVERYSHVLHLVSHVEGRLQAGARCARRAQGRVPGRHAVAARPRSARCS